MSGPAQAGIPVEALTEIDRIRLEASPTFLALTPDGTRLLVSGLVVGPQGDLSSGEISIIDTATNSVVERIPLGEGFAFGVAITPDGSRAYVAVSRASGDIVSGGPNRIEVIDLATRRLAETVEVVPAGSAYGPIGIALTPDGRRAYVTHRGSGMVLALDTDPDSPTYHSILASIFTGGNPIGLDISPDGSRAYVALRATSDISVIDTRTNVEVARFPVDLGPSGSVTSVALTPEGDRAYVTYASDSRFTTIDTDPSSGTLHTVLATVDTGTGRDLNQIAVSADGNLTFVASYTSAELLVIDSARDSETLNMILAGVAVGDGPIDVAYQRQLQAVAYVSNGLDGSISVVGISCGLALEDLIHRLSPGDFSHVNHQRALLNKVSSFQQLLDNGNVCAAGQKLLHDVYPKADGAPRPEDWVTGPEAQPELQALILRCLAQIEVQARAAGGCR